MTLATESFETHEVFNQPGPLSDYNLYSSDPLLARAVARETFGASDATLLAAGEELGSAGSFENGRLANINSPKLVTHDLKGARVDQIEFHPAWHAIMAGITARGLHCGPWDPAGNFSHATRAAHYILQAQPECGTLCPTTMTYGAIAAMRRDPWLNTQWVPTLLRREYDPRDLPFTQKTGGLVGMGMTEKQGGSDVRANTTVATRVDDGEYRLVGHKWFFSAPQCDAHLVLAQAERGLSCFFVPRFAPDGKKNAVQIQRLKDKLGNRSNASAEVEFVGAFGRLIGEEGRGIPTILEMGTYTRLDCVSGTSGMMRQAVVQAIYHARERSVFGRLLSEQPLMQAVLADLALESIAASSLALRLARAFDAADDENEAVFRRVMTSAAKFWVCKRGPELAAEAMEVLGGNGYVEDWALARIYREMPVNSIWEGSGNIMCLDVLRAFARSPQAATVLTDELAKARGNHPIFDAAFAELARALKEPVLAENAARHWTKRIVLLLQASLLFGLDDVVADAFCRTRLDGEASSVFGASAARVDARVIIERCLPS